MMVKKSKREHFKLHFRCIYATFGTMVAAFLLTIVVLVCSLIWPDFFMTDAEKVKQMVETSAKLSSEICQAVTEICNAQPAIINAKNADAEDGASHFYVIFQNEQGLTRQTAEDGILNLRESQEYHFNASVEVGMKTAENVRILVKMPEYLVLNQPATAKILIASDNAAPYYESWTFYYDGVDFALENADQNETAAEEVTESDDLESAENSGLLNPPECLKLTYEPDSAVLHSNALIDGAKLDYRLMAESGEGALLGADALDGQIPRGNAGTCVVSWVIKTSPANLPVTSNRNETNSLETVYQNELTRFTKKQSTN